MRQIAEERQGSARWKSQRWNRAERSRKNTSHFARIKKFSVDVERMLQLWLQKTTKGITAQHDYRAADKLLSNCTLHSHTCNSLNSSLCSLLEEIQIRAVRRDSSGDSAAERAASVHETHIAALEKLTYAIPLCLILTGLFAPFPSIFILRFSIFTLECVFMPRSRIFWNNTFFKTYRKKQIWFPFSIAGKHPAAHSLTRARVCSSPMPSRINSFETFMLHLFCFDIFRCFFASHFSARYSVINARLVTRSYLVTISVVETQNTQMCK